MKMKKKTVLSAVLCLSLFGGTSASFALEPGGTRQYDGIDVSVFQGDIDFNSVRDSGVEFVYIKASEGTTLIDPNFEANYAGAKEAGLLVGVYHFVRAQNVSEAQAEARFFADNISGKDIDGKLAMDFEVFDGLTNEQVNEISLAFINELIEVTGMEVVIYSDASNATDVFGEELTQYSLWVAEYGVDEPSDSVIWDTWAGWQYSDTGSVPGISGNVDLDYFTDEMLMSNNTPEEPEPSPEPEPEPEPGDTVTISYTVQRGDTLSAIARRYGTTVSAIVAENNISNPNLIFPGQVLRITVERDEDGNTTYTVQRGDTLSEIARRFGTTVSAIVATNNIANPNLIFPGQVLRIPVGGGETGETISYTVQRGDTLSEIALRHGTTVSELVRLNNISNPNLIYAGQKLLIPNR